MREHIAHIDMDNRQLAVRKLFGKRSVAFSELRKLTIVRAELALFDDIGFLFQAADGQTYWAIEAQPGFMPMAKLLALDEVFGGDWYARAERNELPSIDIALP